MHRFRILRTLPAFHIVMFLFSSDSLWKVNTSLHVIQPTPVQLLILELVSSSPLGSSLELLPSLSAIHSHTEPSRCTATTLLSSLLLRLLSLPVCARVPHSNPCQEVQELQ